MEMWFIILISLCICALLTSIFTHFRSSKKLPPGPFISFSVLTNLLWLRRSSLQMEYLLRSFISKYGPILTLRIGFNPTIFIADHSIAHKALVLNSSLFADRPPALPISQFVTSNQHDISSASYGPLWRLLRRNLASQIIHPSRLRSYSQVRKLALDNLFNRLQSHAQSRTPVCTTDHFRYAMLHLMASMCFGDKLDEFQINEIRNVQSAMRYNFNRFNSLNFFPKLTKILLSKRWEELVQLRRNQEKVFLPLIEARRKAIQNRENRGENEEEFVVTYVDTLLDLELPEEKRKFTDEELVTIASEFTDGGTYSTSTTLQWIMAYLVKYPELQDKVLAEMKGVMGDRTEEVVKEEDLEKLPYLKAVVLEGLRRHPPGHFLLPHAVKEDTMLENFFIPKNGILSFMVAEMGRDPKVWEDPMAFKPERFMKGGEVVEFDLTGNKEIKMMPFGAGRRICPGIGAAILHLEYFLANLIWRFEWKAVDGEEVDLSEKVEPIIVMKEPLRANVISRF